MPRFKVGVLVDCLGLGVKEGCRKAAELGAEGVQVYCTRGEMHPDELSRTGRRDFAHFLKGLGLELPALCADFGRGYTKPELFEELIPLTKKCLDLAVDLRTKVVTTHIGVVPEEESDPARAAMVDALAQIGEHADARGVSFATETGPESPSLLASFLRSLGCEALTVNYDPANLAMKGFDPVAGVGELGEFIAHTHAKDGVRGKGEVPLGKGDVDWPAYLAALDGAGYDGFLTIERERGTEVVEDVRRGVEFLRSL